MDLRKHPQNNDFLTIFTIVLLRTSSHSLTSHLGISSNTHKALDDLISNCLLSMSVTGSKVSIMDMQDPSISGTPCDMVLEGKPLCIFSTFLSSILLKQWILYLSELITFWRIVWLVCSTLFTKLKAAVWFSLHTWNFS